MSGPFDVVTGVFDQAKQIATELRTTATAELAKAGLVVTETPELRADPLALGRVGSPAAPGRITDIGLDAILRRNAGLTDTLKGVVDQRTQEYFDTIFPLDGNITAAQGWLARVLGGQGALDPVLEERLWERDRARARRDAARATDEVMATWAGRGYALPPGGAVGAVLAVQRTAMEQAAQASNAIAIKTYETEIGLMKDAIDLTIRMRVESISRMAEYIKIAAIEPMLMNEVQQSATDVEAKLVAAANEYFRLEAAYAGYQFDKDKEFIAFGRDFNKLVFETEMQRIDKRVQLALQAAQMASTQAAAALNGIHAQAAISGSSSDSTSTQLFG